MQLDFKKKIIINDNIFSLQEVLNKFYREKFENIKFIKKELIGISEHNSPSLLSKILLILKTKMIPVLISPEYDNKFLLKTFKRIGVSHSFLNDKYFYLQERKWDKTPFDIVMFSSGSTGLPEALAIPFNAFKNNAKMVGKFLKLTNNDVHLGTFSFCYMSGFYNSFLLPLLTNGIPILTNQFSIFKLKSFLKVINKYKPTIVWTSPHVLKILTSLNQVKKTNFKSVKYFISCTAPLLIEQKLEFQKKFDIPVLQSYGLCETLINTIQSDTLNYNDDSVGKTIGSKNSIVVKKNQKIVISNRSLYKGVIKKINLVYPKGLKNHSFETNDLGFFDKNNNLFITGRESNVINIDGKKFLPETYEKKIMEFNKIQECAIFLNKNKKNNSSTYFFYVSKNFIRKDVLVKQLEKSLPKVLFPKKFIRLKKLPHTKNNKIDRKLLKNYLT